MTPAELRTIRTEELRLTQEGLAEVLQVTRRTVAGWEAATTPIPHTVELAIDNIRRHRAAMQGNNYPLMGDVLRVMDAEGLDLEAAVRAFGVRP